MVQPRFWPNCQSYLSKAIFVGDLADEGCCPAAAPSLLGTHGARFAGASAKTGLFWLEGFNLKVGFMAPKMGFRGLGLVFWSCVLSLCFLGLHSTQCKAGAWGALSPC